MQLGFYFDQSRCIGCFTCMAACRSWNQLDQEVPDLVEVIPQERGEFPNVFLSHLFLTCFHCAQPACIDACPEGHFLKRAEDGVVVITNQELCTNCQLCVEACPYDAIKIVTGARVEILKCDFCLDRFSGNRVPACVAACPVEALSAGPMEELITRHGELRELEGFANYRKTNPSIVFRTINHRKS